MKLLVGTETVDLPTGSLKEVLASGRWKEEALVLPPDLVKHYPDFVKRRPSLETLLIADFLLDEIALKELINNFSIAPDAFLAFNELIPGKIPVQRLLNNGYPREISHFFYRKKEILFRGVSINETSIRFYLLTKSKHRSGNVFMRITSDNWTTFEDIKAEFDCWSVRSLILDIPCTREQRRKKFPSMVKDLCNGRASSGMGSSWSVVYQFPSVNRHTLEFAFCLEEDNTFWDNNYGFNFRLFSNGELEDSRRFTNLTIGIVP